MAMSREARVEYFEALRKKEPEQTKRIYYKNESQILPVCKIDVRYIQFNRHNGRLETEMQTWKADTGGADDVYTDEIHNLIQDFLWKTNIQKNKRTKLDIERKGQLNPGIVTLDGVIIDGNRRAMLLQKSGVQFFEAVVLPDAYDENEQEIVRLETQYQLGEDQKVDYGPLEKYLHAKRLRDLGLEDEAPTLMNLDSPAKFENLIQTMELMDDYLAHIGCPGMYNLLKDKDGTKEGMFVDLFNDLKKVKSGNSGMIQWDPGMSDILDLTTIQFDYIRYGDEFIGTGKDYRKISHSSAESKNCFFAHESIWKKFSDSHRLQVQPLTNVVGTVDDFIEEHKDDYAKKSDAAKAWNNAWKESVKPKMQENFGLAKEDLEEVVEELEPNRLLLRALRSMAQIDIEGGELVRDDRNLPVIKDINHLSYEMKKRFE
jgi:hypothetical protein